MAARSLRESCGNEALASSSRTCDEDVLLRLCPRAGRHLLDERLFDSPGCVAFNTLQRSLRRNLRFTDATGDAPAVSIDPFAVDDDGELVLEGQLMARCRLDQLARCLRHCRHFQSQHPL